MAHTEEQAREKWCPQGKWTVDNEGVFHNTRGHSGGKVNGYEACIASDCMMWVKTATDEELSEAACHRDYVALKSMGRCGLAR